MDNGITVRCHQRQIVAAYVKLKVGVIVTLRINVWVIRRIALLCLVRGKDNPKLAGLNLESVRELPLVPVVNTVGQVPAIRTDCCVRRIVNLEPVGGFAVSVEEFAVFQRYLAGVARHELADDQMASYILPVCS